jgi:hypothetical protein
MSTAKSRPRVVLTKVVDPERYVQALVILLGAPERQVD